MKTMAPSSQEQEQDNETNKLYMHEDLVEEVLLRLPIKPLHQCKSLSKSSRSLISSDRFLQRYQKSAGGSPLFLGFFYEFSERVPYGFPTRFLPAFYQGMKLNMQGLDTSLRFLKPTAHDDFDSNRTKFYVRASSNGFLLCGTPVYPLYYYVYNPLTRQYTNLPNRSMEFLVSSEAFICRGNGHPCLDWVIYKVTLCSHIINGCLQVEIFSSSTSQWVALQFTTNIPYLLLALNGPPVMTKAETVCIKAAIDGQCVMFNASKKTNVLKIITPPEPTDSIHLGQSQGFIYMAFERYMWYDDFKTWELDEDEAKWYLKYSVKITELFSGCSGDDLLCCLAIHPSNSTVILVRLRNMISVVDIKKKSIDLMSEYPDVVLRYCRKYRNYPDKSFSYHWFPYQWPCSVITIE